MPPISRVETPQEVCQQFQLVALSRKVISNTFAKFWPRSWMCRPVEPCRRSCFNTMRGNRSGKFFRSVFACQNGYCQVFGEASVYFKHLQGFSPPLRSQVCPSATRIQEFAETVWLSFPSAQRLPIDLSEPEDLSMT